MRIPEIGLGATAKTNRFFSFLNKFYIFVQNYFKNKRHFYNVMK